MNYMRWSLFFMALKQSLKKRKKQQDAFLLFYNKGLSNEEIARQLNCSVRTICRWKKEANQTSSLVSHSNKKKYARARHFSLEIFNRMVMLKQEAPQRSAQIIFLKLQTEFPAQFPSESTIRKYLVGQGFEFKKVQNRQGYIKFQRKSPNELWQIDIAGVQTVGHLGHLYLIAIMDDCSRFIVSAQYFSNQSGENVMKIIRDAIMTHGRPNEMVSDNGTQFRNLIKEYESRYINLLNTLDIKPIFARKNHPQTKGKLERWFGTVIQLFLLEARLYVKEHPEITLPEFNDYFQEWIHWYNERKSHRSLPHKCTPNEVFQNARTRIFRPLTGLVDWNQWINNFIKRKVNKYNMLSFKGISINLPSGYVGCQVELLDFDDRIEFYWQQQLIMTHSKISVDFHPAKRPIYRRIAQNGTIQYRKQWINIDYKLAGKKVEIKESSSAKELLLYLDQVLIKRVKLE